MTDRRVLRVAVVGAGIAGLAGLLQDAATQAAVRRHWNTPVQAQDLGWSDHRVGCADRRMPAPDPMVLAEALLVGLATGVKVATLPVVALGVGIGMDCALCILSLTLAIGVVTWVASPIKFQADLGLLLAFRFLWNRLGALVLLPALAHFLLKPRVDGAPPAASPRARLATEVNP